MSAVRRAIWAPVFRAKRLLCKSIHGLGHVADGILCPVQVKAGSLVLLHGANVHYSNENTSGISRHAYSVHVCEGAGDVSWAADNW